MDDAPFPLPPQPTEPAPSGPPPEIHYAPPQGGSSSANKIIAGIIILLLVIVLPAVLFVARQNQEIRQRAQTYVCSGQGGLNQPCRTPEACDNMPNCDSGLICNNGMCQVASGGQCGDPSGDCFVCNCPQGCDNSSGAALGQCKPETPGASCFHTSCSTAQLSSSCGQIDFFLNGSYCGVKQQACAGSCSHNTGGPTPSPGAPAPSPSSGAPVPTPSASPAPTPSGGTGGTPTILVTKTVDKTNVAPGDILTYTVRVTNTSPTTLYDAYIDENLSDYTDYDGPSMYCTKTDVSANSTVVTGFEIDDLTTSTVQSVAENASLDQFRIANSLNEDNNTWDLDQNDYITCTYRARVLGSVTNGTQIINAITGYLDTGNGNQSNEQTLSQSASTTVTVSTQCNYACTDNSQCGGGSMICYIVSGQTSGVCRNPSCPTSGNCACINGSPSPTPTITTTPQVPHAGTSWPTVVMVAFALILLTVGFAL